MARDFQVEARREAFREEAVKQWVQERIKTLHDKVTAHDVLRRFGVKLQYTADRAEQISCPFHGVDNRPSARVYPESVEGPSHVWCWVCRERWDCIGLWKRHTGFEGRFTALLRDIERAFGITPPETPEGIGNYEHDEDAEEVAALFDVCEKRLMSAKGAFDMKGFLTLGLLLDRVRHDFNKKLLPATDAKISLRKILDKIGEKVRSCPDE
jgi:hypothetical protein